MTTGGTRGRYHRRPTKTITASGNPDRAEIDLGEAAGLGSRKRQVQVHPNRVRGLRGGTYRLKAKVWIPADGKARGAVQYDELREGCARGVIDGAAVAGAVRLDEIGV